MIATLLLWAACTSGTKDPEGKAWPDDMCNCWLDTGYEDLDGDRHDRIAWHDCAPLYPDRCTDCDCDYSTVAEGDCDDDDPSRYPGAADYWTCDDSGPSRHGGPDGIDNDCDGSVDEDVRPDEQCNGMDDDCNGNIDEGTTMTLYADADGDGYGDDATTVESCEAATGWLLVGGDCNDANAEISPEATDVADGIDNDCDGVIDG